MNPCNLNKYGCSHNLNIRSSIERKKHTQRKYLKYWDRHGFLGKDHTNRKCKNYIKWKLFCTKQDNAHMRKEMNQKKRAKILAS